MSNDELAANNQIQSSEIPSNNTPGTGQTGSGNAMSSVPFRFPKTKKSLMSDWLQESESNSAYDEKYGDFEFEEEEQNQQENPESMS